MPGNDWKCWHDRAAETRAIAQRATDPHVRRVLIKIVESYEELAERARQIAERRKAG